MSGNGNSMVGHVHCCSRRGPCVLVSRGIYGGTIMQSASHPLPVLSLTKKPSSPVILATFQVWEPPSPVSRWRNTVRKRGILSATRAPGIWSPFAGDQTADPNATSCSSRLILNVKLYPGLVNRGVPGQEGEWHGIMKTRFGVQIRAGSSRAALGIKKSPHTLRKRTECHFPTS